MKTGKQKTQLLVSFGLRVKVLRQKRGLSQEDLAEEAGLDRSYVGGIERGERNPTLVNLVKISSALKLSISDVLDGV